MKTYLNAVAFTLSIGAIFLLSALSSTFISKDCEIILKLNSCGNGVPTENGFILIWGAVYLCVVILLSITIANKCLRRSIKLWGIIGALNLIFTLTYFKLNLTYFGVAIIIIEIIILIILTNFYIKNTQAVWLFTIPILAVYGYSLFLAVMLI